jgi:O-antigen ligase
MPLVGAVFLGAYLSWRPSLDILFTLSDALFLLAAMQLVVARRIPLEPFGVLTPVWLLSFATMMLGLAIGSVSGADPIRWIIVASQYGFAWVILPFLLMGHGQAAMRHLATAMLAGVVVMETVGIAVILFYHGTFEESRSLLGLDFISGAGRLGAFATDANWNGATISMALPFAFYLTARRLIRPWLGGLAIGILMFALLLTASATAFGSALAAIAIFVVAGAVRPRLSVLMMVGVLLVAIAQWQIALPAAFEKRVGGAITSGNIAGAGTYTGRILLIEEAWKRVGDHMIVGVGVDQDRIVSRLRAPVHNMYLLIWVEGGGLALLGWLGMMVAFLVTAFGAFRRDRLASGLALSVMGTFLLFSTASPHMYARLWAVPVLLALGVARTSNDDPLRPDRLPTD